MGHVSNIIGHLAWPVVALIIGYWLVRELRNGLLVSLFPHGGSLEAAGIELEVKAAEAALAAAGVEKIASPTRESAPDVIQDESPYETIIASWREVSSLIADLAAKHGGRRDARYAYDNIALLEDKQVITDDIGNAARALFRARNSFRRLPPDQVTAEAAYDFAVNAGSLTGYLKMIS